MPEQLLLVDMDPDWPGLGPKPEGEGWIWVVSVLDVLSRFGEYSDLEMFLPATLRYTKVHKEILKYGKYRGHFGLTVSGRTEFGWSSYDIEGRGGGWVRFLKRFPKWAEEKEEDDEY